MSKKKSQPTIAIPAWHWGELSGTGRVEHTFIDNIEGIKNYNFLVTLPLRNSLFNQSLKKLPHLQWKFIPTDYPDYPKRIEDWLKQCYQFFLKEKVDLILYFSPDVFIPKKNSIRPIPFVSIIHDVMNLTLKEYRFNPFKYWSEKRKLLTSKNAKKVITVSEFSKRQILKHLPFKEEQIKVIYNAISPKTPPIKPAPKKEGSYLLYVGDFRKRKNVFTLVKAFTKLNPSLKEKYTLYLTGEGALKKKIASYLAKKNSSAKKGSKLKSKVKFLGRVNNEDLPSLYSGADLFAFPSLAEGFGLPVLEAQANGVAVICGKHSSLQEIAGRDKESVLYAQVDKVEDLKNKIELLLTNPLLRKEIAEKGKENSKKFNIKKMLEGYKQIFSALIV